MGLRQKGIDFLRGAVTQKTLGHEVHSVLKELPDYDAVIGNPEDKRLDEILEKLSQLQQCSDQEWREFFISQIKISSIGGGDGLKTLFKSAESHYGGRQSYDNRKIERKMKTLITNKNKNKNKNKDLSLDTPLILYLRTLFAPVCRKLPECLDDYCIGGYIPFLLKNKVFSLKMEDAFIKQKIGGNSLKPTVQGSGGDFNSFLGYRFANNISTNAWTQDNAPLGHDLGPFTKVLNHTGQHFERNLTVKKALDEFMQNNRYHLFDQLKESILGMIGRYIERLEEKKNRLAERDVVSRELGDVLQGTTKTTKKQTSLTAAKKELIKKTLGSQKGLEEFYKVAVQNFSTKEQLAAALKDAKIPYKENSLNTLFDVLGSPRTQGSPQRKKSAPVAPQKEKLNRKKEKIVFDKNNPDKSLKELMMQKFFKTTSTLWTESNIPIVVQGRSDSLQKEKTGGKRKEDVFDYIMKSGLPPVGMKKEQNRSYKAYIFKLGGFAGSIGGAYRAVVEFRQDGDGWTVNDARVLSHKDYEKTQYKKYGKKKKK